MSLHESKTLLLGSVQVSLIVLAESASYGEP